MKSCNFDQWFGQSMNRAKHAIAVISEKPRNGHLVIKEKKAERGDCEGVDAKLSLYCSDCRQVCYAVFFCVWRFCS